MVVMFLIDIENNCLLALATCLIGAALYKCAWWRSAAPSHRGACGTCMSHRPLN